MRPPTLYMKSASLFQLSQRRDSHESFYKLYRALSDYNNETKKKTVDRN